MILHHKPLGIFPKATSLTNMDTLSLSLSLGLFLTHTYTQTHTQTHTHMHTHPLGNRYAHKCARTITHELTAARERGPNAIRSSMDNPRVRKGFLVQAAYPIIYQINTFHENKPVTERHMERVKLCSSENQRNIT